MCVILHVLAALLWLGHMFFWSLIVGPITKRMQPLETANRVRELSLRWGALGWPALFVLIPTGVGMLWLRGLTWSHLVAGTASGDGMAAIRLKIVLVIGMVFYQAVIGHHRAPTLIYVNMAAALVIVGLSVVFVRMNGLSGF